jgi:hypothetical protein
MENIIEVKITKFELCYDGLFKLRFAHKERKVEAYAYLTPRQFFELLKAEGYGTSKTADELDEDWITFENSAIMLEAFMTADGKIESLITECRADDWQDKGIFMVQVETEINS